MRNWFLFAASGSAGARGRRASTSGFRRQSGGRRMPRYTILAASLAYQFGLEWGAVPALVPLRSSSTRPSGAARTSPAIRPAPLRAAQPAAADRRPRCRRSHIPSTFVASVGFRYNEGGGARSCATCRSRSTARRRRDRPPPRLRRHRRRIRVMSWSTAQDLKAQLMRLWERAASRREVWTFRREPLPGRLSLKTPSSGTTSPAA